MPGAARAAGRGCAIQHSKLICVSLLPIALFCVLVAIYICIYNIVFRQTTFYYMYLSPSCWEEEKLSTKSSFFPEEEKNVDRDIQDVRPILPEVE